MGRYVSLWLRFDQPNGESELLRGAFECEFFRPQALGALGNKGPQSRDSNWYLGGWGLEHFVATYTGYAKNMRTHRFFFPTSGLNEEAQYLSYIADNIKMGRRPDKELSPFEQVDENLGVTFLTSPSLPEEMLLDCMGVLSSMPQRIIELCGNFHVAVRDSVNRDWTTAYRFTFESEPTVFVPIATPFVTLTARTEPSEPEVTQLTIFTESTIWLNAIDSLNGQVHGSEADLNLSRLQSLVETIIENTNIDLQSADISIEGAIFNREAERIRFAFSDMLKR